MAEATHDAVHRHEPPKSFIRKYIFSLDHKVIGIQYYFLGLFSVFIGMFLPAGLSAKSKGPKNKGSIEVNRLHDVARKEELDDPIDHHPHLAL